MKIYKNFLKEEDFLKIKNVLLSDFFPWYFCPKIVDSEKYFQFFHNFYTDYSINSSFFNLIEPMVKKIKPMSILRIKANLLYQTKKIEEHGMHTDYPINERTTGIKTAIFYCNNNNGYTKFKEGIKIKSEENKFIEFDVNKEHTGSSCTDEQRRIVINFNYYK
jgi:hypothetical protein